MPDYWALDHCVNRLIGRSLPPWTMIHTAAARELTPYVEAMAAAHAALVRRSLGRDRAPELAVVEPHRHLPQVAHLHHLAQQRHERRGEPRPTAQSSVALRTMVCLYKP